MRTIKDEGLQIIVRQIMVRTYIAEKSITDSSLLLSFRKRETKAEKPDNEMEMARLKLSTGMNHRCSFKLRILFSCLVYHSLPDVLV